MVLSNKSYFIQTEAILICMFILNECSVQIEATYKTTTFILQEFSVLDKATELKGMNIYYPVKKFNIL